MKLRTKIFLGFIVIIALLQVPFIYRRYQISKLSEDLAKLNAERVEVTSNFRDYKGIIHAHTSLGGHSTGHFEELIKAAQANDLDFVIMTEHTSEFFDTSALTLKGKYGKTLFVNGQETNTASGDRFLLIPGHADSFADERLQTHDFIEKYKSQGRLVLVAYPERLKTQEANFDGIEIFSLNTNAKKMNPFLFFFDYIWSSKGYDDLLLTKYFVRPDRNLQQYDELTERKRLTLFAGTDAHSNIGFFLLGDDAGNKLLYLKLDPYKTTFSLMRNHVLLEKGKELNEQTLLEAIKNGKVFIGVDRWADTSGFSFTVNDDKTMGDEIELATSASVRLKIHSPLPAKVVLLRNGQQIHESNGTDVSFDANEKGTYRVEVYLDSYGFKMPWIISNPIYVR